LTYGVFSGFVGSSARKGSVMLSLSKCTIQYSCLRFPIGSVALIAAGKNHP
jgi:hypothetical protein